MLKAFGVQGAIGALPLDTTRAYKAGPRPKTYDMNTHLGCSVYLFMFKAYRGLNIYLINVKSSQRARGFVPWNPPPPPTGALPLDRTHWEPPPPPPPPGQTPDTSLQTCDFVSDHRQTQ